MKRLLCFAAAMLVLTAASAVVLSQERSPNKPRTGGLGEPVASLEGTTWAGTDSDGDFYEYTFLPGGQLRFRTDTSRDEIVTFEDEGDVWAQNGPLVIIVISDYATRVGTIRGDRITGKAWNVKERRWTWEVTKKR